MALKNIERASSSEFDERSPRELKALRRRPATTRVIAVARRRNER